MSALRLSIGCDDYDRTRALYNGMVQPEGIELVVTYLHEQGLAERRVAAEEPFAAETLALAPATP